MTIDFKLSALNLVLGAMGGFLGLYGSFSYLIKERFFLGEAPLAVIIGILLERLGAVPSQLASNPGDGQEDPLDQIGLGVSRIVIGIQLVLVGIQLPYQYLRIEFRSLAMLLVPVMTTMWIIVTGLNMLCVPNLSLLSALILASCTTPTDPVLSNAIVKGSFADQHVSPRLRNLISAESGANDGFAFTFLFLPLLLLKGPKTADGDANLSKALLAWFLETCLYRVVGAVIFGALVGVIANRILRLCTTQNWIDRESFLCYGVATGIFTVGIAGILDLDDLLAAFVAGNALTWDDWYRQETEDDELQNVVDLLLNTAYFIFVGATIPWSTFSHLPYGLTSFQLLALCVSVLFLRRLPALLLFYKFIPALASLSETAFMGYFGPIGAGAIFYANLVLDQFEDDEDAPLDSPAATIRALVKPLTYSLVLTSLVGHTLAIPLLKRFLDWKGIGNIKLMGHELDDDDDNVSFLGQGDEDRRQTAADRREEEYEAGQSPAPGEEGPFGRPESDAVRQLSSPFDPIRRGPNSSVLSSVHQPSSGAYGHDGTWHPQASWRMSSSHQLPSTGHKLGTHVAFENEERLQQRRASAASVEEGRNSTEPSNSTHPRRTSYFE